MSNLTLSVSPHIRSKISTRTIMLDVIIALMPALLASVIIFGFRAILLTAVSAATCVATEYIWEKALKMDITVGDLSAVVTGILLAFNVPSGMPVWQLMIGDIAAIAVVKMLFGGIGCNFVNPALVGRIVLMFSYTTGMTTYVFPNNGIDALSSATPLAAEGLKWADIGTLLLGNHGGVIGETCVIALVLGGVYLVIKEVIKPATPLAYIGTTFVFSLLFSGFDFEYAVLTILSGGLFLGAIFMATDYVTTPITTKGKIVFGIGCGFITAVIRAFGNYAEGVTFSILLMNLVVPYINDLTRTKPFGEVKAK